MRLLGNPVLDLVEAFLEPSSLRTLLLLSFSALASGSDRLKGNHAARDVVEVGLHFEPARFLVLAVEACKDVAVSLANVGVRLGMDLGWVHLLVDVILEIFPLLLLLRVAVPETRGRYGTFVRGLLA
ncbi:hypothetical protein HG530_007301 [Fusarium avenaceum]|nr:hypothetical protein HG530_007301 [Fusarium avenaceum]